MRKLVLHPQTEQQISLFLQSPTHALLLIAPTGSGKAALSHELASQLLELKSADVFSSPYLRTLQPIDGKAIPIETVRELEHFLSLIVPGVKTTNRVVIIEDSHLLTTEAQNALLKTLEEPPVSTVLILTASQEQTLLPTLRSRLQTIAVQTPQKEQLLEHFIADGFEQAKTRRAYTMTGGLPGLMQALLSQADHPLANATVYARQLLQGTIYDRMLLVDELSKQRTTAQDVCFILQQMAHVSLQLTKGTVGERWQTVLQASYEAAEELTFNGQPKLVLTKLMLNLS